MDDPQVPLNAKHILFSLSMIACLIIGFVSGFLSLAAATDSNYLAAGICLIPATMSFGLILISNLILLKR